MGSSKYYPVNSGGYWHHIKIHNPSLHKFVKTEICAVVVEGEDYDQCVEASKNQWSSSKSGNYLNPKDQFQAERTGLLGEMAFAMIFGLPVDLSYRETGDDGWDFMLSSGHKIDVKTNIGYQRFNPSYCIRFQEETFETHRLNADIYVVGYIYSEDKENKKAVVYLVGCEKVGDMLNDESYHQPSRYGSWTNIELQYYKLRSFRALYNSIVALNAKSETETTT